MQVKLPEAQQQRRGREGSEKTKVRMMGAHLPRSTRGGDFCKEMKEPRETGRELGEAGTTEVLERASQRKKWDEEGGAMDQS